MSAIFKFSSRNVQYVSHPGLHYVATSYTTVLWFDCLSPFLFFSTLVIGGAGSLMLDLYGWESVFYVSGLLSVLWAYCMWKYLLKGEGK